MTGCVVTTPRSGPVWRRIRQLSLTASGALRAVRGSDLVGPARCRWCAIATMTTSVPTAYGHRAVMIRGYVDRVEIVCGSEQIARHRRSYAREDFVFDPLHYLAALERSRVRSTRRRRWRAGNCPTGSVCCAGCSKPAWARLASGSSCGFCVCWKRSPSTMSPPPLAPPGARRDRLRCRQASGAVPDRAAATAARSDLVSLSAQGRGPDDMRTPIWVCWRDGRHERDAQVLLGHHLKALRLPTFLREYDKVARQCRRGRRSRPLSAPPGRAGDDRPGAAPGRAADPSGPFSQREPRQL